LGIILEPSLPVQTRAQFAREVLTAGVRGGSDDLYDPARQETDSNPLARLTVGPLEKLAFAVHDGEEQATVSQLADMAIREDTILSMGLLNVLAMAKLGGAFDDTLQEIERRLIQNVRTTNFIDRSTDYSSAWLLMNTLLDKPRFDVAAIKEIAELVETHVLSDDVDAKNDPWGVRELLDRADGLQ